MHLRIQRIAMAGTVNIANCVHSLKSLCQLPGVTPHITTYVKPQAVTRVTEWPASQSAAEHCASSVLLFKLELLQQDDFLPQEIRTTL